MITVDEYLSHWKEHYGHCHVPEDELTDPMRKQAEITVDRVNALLAYFGHPREITSGWRPKSVNSQVRGAAPNSKHCICLACDIADGDGQLDAFCFADANDHPDDGILAELELWMEDPKHTPGWTHVQTIPFNSWRPGRPRWFVP